MSEYFERVERHLTDAVARQARHGHRRRWSLGQPRDPRRRVRSVVLSLGGIAVVCAVSVAFLHLHGAHEPQQHPSTRLAHAPSVAQRLVAELRVLRKPQTPAARAFNHSRTLKLAQRRAKVELRLTREVNLQDGIRVWLYVESRTTSGAAGGLGVTELRHGNGSGGCCISPELLRRRGPFLGIAYSSAPHPHQAYVEVVPDGVARVRWIFPPHPLQDPALGPFRQALKVTVAVHDNLAASVLPDRGAAKTVIWYDAHGDPIAHHTTP